MLTFSQFITEKQIIVGEGESYGQIIFLAGGGGSGKGFALSNMIDSRNFKVRDVDEMKQSIIKLDNLFNNTKKLPNCNKDSIKIDDKGQPTCNPFSGAKDLDLRNPSDVFALHQIVTELGWKNKTLELMLAAANPSKLPNIVFDITGKKKTDITQVVPMLTKVGYEAKNIHLIWVLSNYVVAVTRNANRSRIVPEDVLLQTHEGAATTMFAILNGSVPKDLNGGIYVILNRDLKPEEDFHISTTNNKTSAVSHLVSQNTLKNFDYIKVKNAGKMLEPGDWHTKVQTWIVNNIPKTNVTAHIFDKGLGEETIRPANSLGLTRDQMPQIRSFDVPEFLKLLSSHGISNKHETINANELKPTQKEINGDKARTVDPISKTKPMLVTADNFIMDGHHRWLNAVWNNEKLNIIRLNAPIQKILVIAKTFSKTEYANLTHYHQ